MSYVDFYGSTKYNSSIQDRKFSPLDFSDLEVWLDGADASTISLNGSNVSQWDDKSGNSNNAVQGSPSNQPLYSIAGLNGNNVLTFDGISDHMLISSLANSLSGAVTMFAVFADASNGYVYDSISVANRIAFANAAPNAFGFRGSVLFGGPVDHSPQLISIIYDGVSSSIYTNGVLDVSGDMVTNSVTDLTIAARFALTASAFLEGPIGELIIFRKKLPPNEFLEANTALLKKWGL